MTEIAISVNKNELASVLLGTFIQANAMQKKRELMPSLSLLTLFIHQRNRLVGGHVRLNETNYIW